MSCRRIRHRPWRHDHSPDNGEATPGPQGTDARHRQKATEAELSAQQAQLRSALADDALPSDDDDVEHMLLVFGELGSNGLRHGRPRSTSR